MDCIFCKIAKREIESHIIYEDDQTIAFDDIHPQAPLHKLIIPRQHIATLNDINADTTHIIGHMVRVAQQLAKQLEIAEDGYRIVINCNDHGGQEVYHIHLHLLGGRQMHWPPG
jgi:histidine triad (HIT) family protein